MTPVLACPNILENPVELRDFAFDLGFGGVDWSLNATNVPIGRIQEIRWIKAVKNLTPLRVRFHCYFPELELASVDRDEAKQALSVLKRVLDVAAEAVERPVLTAHLGLNRSEDDLSWDTGVNALRALVSKAGMYRASICLENLTTGWTRRPELFSALVETSGCKVTFDIGHALFSRVELRHAEGEEEFIAGYRARVIHTHVYHRETRDGHSAPRCLEDIESRLRLLSGLPLCNWWTLELREERALISALGVVRSYLQRERVSRAG